MHAFFKVASAFALLAYSSATPVVQRSSHHQAHFELPKTFAALGDSYAAGLGSGFFTNNSRDGLDIQCLRQDGGYPTQLLKILKFFGLENDPFDNVSCSGDELADIDAQVERLEKRKFDLITLTIGGNDFGFDDAALNCVYAQIQPDVNAQAVCDATLDAAMKLAKDPAFWKLLSDKLHLIKDKALADNGHLFVTGYGKFFDEPIDGDACDKISFFPIPQLAALNMTAGNRRRANEVVDLVNKNIEQTIADINHKAKRSWPHEQDKKHMKSSKQQIQFINYDKFFENKRFCEQANAADPIGSNNPQVFFNDLVTILPLPGVAPLDKQTPGLGGVDITDLLQQASVFHPKGALPYVGLTLEIALRILLDAVDSKNVVVGPAEYCTEKNEHKHWSRDGHHDGENSDGKKHHCYNIPAGCVTVKTGEHGAAPRLICEDGLKTYDAEAVEFKVEWDW